jgi:hypothetical protein
MARPTMNEDEQRYIERQRKALRLEREEYERHLGCGGVS